MYNILRIPCMSWIFSRRSQLPKEHSAPATEPDRGIRTEADGATRTEILAAVLNEIRFITRRMKDDAKATQETNDWKWAAMVIDRLCFWVFTVYLTVATIVIFSSASHSA